MVGSDLDCCSDHEDQGEDHERVSTTETIVDERSSNGTEETASSQETDHIRRYLGIFVRRKAALAEREAEINLETIQGQD
jgi:hypothetical protein